MRLVARAQVPRAGSSPEGSRSEVPNAARGGLSGYSMGACSQDVPITPAVLIRSAFRDVRGRTLIDQVSLLVLEDMLRVARHEPADLMADPDLWTTWGGIDDGWLHLAARALAFGHRFRGRTPWMAAFRPPCARRWSGRCKPSFQMNLQRLRIPSILVDHRGRSHAPREQRPCSINHTRICCAFSL